MRSVKDLATEVGVKPACSALNLPRATFYRHRQPTPATPKPRPAPPLALSPSERQEVLDVLHSSRFVDLAPREVWAELIDEGTYLCSVRTMYRILEAENECRERRNQLRRPAYHKPELLATAPNQVWSWDITKLKGPTKWSYFYLYVILDIFSRYVVGWMLADRESGTLARRLIAETIDKHDIPPGQLTIHADRGPSPTAKPVARLYLDLGVTKSHSRPYTSNDNPYSEAQFRTLKYHRLFPERFLCFDDTHAFCRSWFTWYNTEHHHNGVALLTPEQSHYGRAPQMIEHRDQVLQSAFEAHPQRFKGRLPKAPRLPQAVWINPPAISQENSEQPAQQQHLQSTVQTKETP